MSERFERPTLTTVVPTRKVERARVEALEPAAWRLIFSGALDGPLNMAIDEAIAEAVAAGDAPPTLRLYGWQPPCLSLGQAQAWDVVDFARCADLGWDVVRRPTGGRAVLHIDEITYMLCAPEAEPRVRGGVLESYRRLSTGLLAALRQIGVEPERAQSVYADRGESGPACFDGPSDYEITVGQRKLIGSAQLRKKGIVLQHGALPLFGDITRVAEGLAFDLPGQRLALKNRLHWRATTLAEGLRGRQLSLDEAAGFVRQGFAEALNLTLVETTLTPAETARAQVLRAEKYAHSAWTKRL